MFLKFLVEKNSASDLERLAEKNGTTEKILLVNSRDFNYKKFFPNAISVFHKKTDDVDILVDKYYLDLDKKVEDNKFDMIYCTGQLEHVPDPYSFVEILYKKLKKDGKLVITVSSVFAIHDGPEDFFHLTHYGAEVLFSKFKWSHLEIVSSCLPFKTVGILIQRIAMQTNLNKISYYFLQLLSKFITFLDFMIKENYSSREKNIKTRIDSMAPSNLYITAIK